MALLPKLARNRKRSGNNLFGHREENVNPEHAINIPPRQTVNLREKTTQNCRVQKTGDIIPVPAQVRVDIVERIRKKSSSPCNWHSVKNIDESHANYHTGVAKRKVRNDNPNGARTKGKTYRFFRQFF